MKVFKHNLQVLYARWVRSTPTPTGEDRPKPGYDLLCEWVAKAWEDISSDLIKKAFIKGQCWGFTDEFKERVKAAPLNPEYEASTLLLPKERYDQLVEMNQLDGVLDLVVKDLHYTNRGGDAHAEDSFTSEGSDSDDVSTEEEVPVAAKKARRVTLSQPPTKGSTAGKQKASTTKKKTATTKSRKKQTQYQKKVSAIFKKLDSSLVSKKKQVADAPSHVSSDSEGSPALVLTPKVQPPLPSRRSTKVSRLGQMEADQLEWALRESSKLASQQQPHKEGQASASTTADQPNSAKKSNTGPCGCPGGCTHSSVEQRYPCDFEDGCHKFVHHLCYVEWAAKLNINIQDGCMYCHRHCPGLKG